MRVSFVYNHHSSIYGTIKKLTLTPNFSFLCSNSNSALIKKKHTNNVISATDVPLCLEGEVRDNSKSLHSFVTGDLVWGPAKSCPAWPGKLVEVRDDKVLVKWFGGDKALSEVDPCCLQTLTEGLDAHHRARKNLRT